MKKMSSRLFAILLALALVVGMLPIMPVSAAVTAATPRLITQSNYYTFGLTDDTYVGYYAIRNTAELYGFAEIVNGGKPTANGVLLQDIVVNETVSAAGAQHIWTPIGTNLNNAYLGTFDGNGYTISGIYINNTGENMGIFGVVGEISENGGQVKNGNYALGLEVDYRYSRFSEWSYTVLFNVEGQTVGEIAAANNGVLAMNGSGFMDDNGGGDGGTVTGLAVCDGTRYGYSFVAKGEKRLELHEDNLFYIYDTSAPLSENCTDAVEWHPAMVVDGQDVVGAGWDGLQPRACIGQSDKYEILMLVIEGRQPLRSIGITLYDCVDILLAHGCMQAINLDGGTSAMMWYDGEPIISCSNSALISVGGRDLPTAWVYGSK